jgi:predicted RNA-binding Zn-ribbon protein involved in translation (DUF1610 family)
LACCNVNNGAHGWFAQIKVVNCRPERTYFDEFGAELVAAMPAFPQKTLKVVPAPLVETVPTAPPVLEAPDPTVEYKCGNCGAVLMRVGESNVYAFMILCISCGSYNSTDV